MLLSAKAFFDDKTQSNVRLLVRSQETIPQKWLIEYRKAARGAAGVIGAPRRTGSLRRSIITRQVGNRGEVSWRLPYAGAQNRGGHTDKTTHFAPAVGYGRKKKGYRTRPGWFHPYTRYTTPNTGPGFAAAAYQYANSQLGKISREEGLIK